MAGDHPLSAELQRIDRIARLLDSQYRIPGTRFRFGLDSLVGLVPGIGDTLTALPSAWIIWKAHKLGAPRSTLMRMGANTAVDYVVGSIPLVGDLVDLGFKANLRNADLLRDHLTTQIATAPSRPGRASPDIRSGSPEPSDSADRPPRPRAGGRPAG